MVSSTLAPFSCELRNSAVQVVRVVLKIENGISTVQSVESSTVQLGDGRIKNIKFLDNFVFLALWESEGKSSQW